MTDFHLPLNLYLERYPLKYSALYHALRDAVASGRLEYGMKLPSSRELGGLYGLSRGVVSQVYEMLAAEGYVVSGVGRGTFVAYRHDRQPGGGANVQTEFELSAWGRRMSGLPLRQPASGTDGDIRFVIGYSDRNHFPKEAWNRTLYAQVRGMHGSYYGDGFASQGHLALREAICRHLLRTRGIEAVPSSIAIVNGSMQAIALLAQLLIDPGDPVVTENPCYSGILSAIRAAGGEAVAACTDRHGLVPDDWEAKLIFVTPSRQFPTGAVLSLERRQQLLAWASRRGAVVVEDDYDSEFRHLGRPIEPLKLLDREDRVVYIGTFSLTMMHHFRIGYAVLPAALREPFLRARQLFEPHPTAILEQRALASFMNGGEYERHLRRMGRLYSRKFELLQSLLTDTEELAELFEPVASDAGLHLFALWKRSADEYDRFRQFCYDSGVTWTDGTGYYLERPVPSACFGFAHLEETEIKEGISRMAAARTARFSGEEFGLIPCSKRQ
ncbi:MocR-like pyridoxine biosynthesis transcription factor PdxR [Paenibacillus oceani]|uniref:PLP-dependent aminotransferase family protein n=1 Tax=Paenibacillus oceani TaxID=2772510 RepID=A0A927GXH2_9BACL|nr:PLP-dependent aminotransferase family protein [Paenibacillus oceani]MBD2860821.1 PLP-dependent aminotransferase family protein [Paenibacillus oceani]